jgi:uncharacterized protein YndB with AHSA1/START domain
MPTFTLTAHSQAPVEEVWKLLHDPARFPEWWEGIETIAPGADGDYTMWPSGYPDFPMAQRLDAQHHDGRVIISCLVSDLVFRWQLRATGETTDIEVDVEIPEHEAHRVPDQQRLLAQSLRSLSSLAADGRAAATPATKDV